MQMTVEQAEGRVPVTILSLAGALDATNYEQVIVRARELYAEGTRSLIIDMGAVSFLSSAGLVALHHVALILRGTQPPDLEQGWETIHRMAHDRGTGKQPHVRLCSIQPKVERSLHVSGMDEYFELHPDRSTALASFTS